MQALIDFDGWRKWKHFSQTKPAEDNKKAVNGNLNNKSPKAALNGKAQNTPKRDRMMSLGLGKEKAGSDGTDSHGDSGSGETIMKV